MNRPVTHPPCHPPDLNPRTPPNEELTIVELLQSVYREDMTITHQTVVDSEGKPTAAIIPWTEFLLIREIVEGGEVTDEEAATLREAESDRRAGNQDAFTDLASLKADLSL